MQNQTWEHQYLNLLQKVLDEGEVRNDRTGVGTKAIFGQRLDIDLRNGFPAVTTKKLAWRSMLSELKWFIEGSSDERRLAEILHGTRDPEKKTIWSDNAGADYWKPKTNFEGDLGRVYGTQWRSWRTARTNLHVDSVGDIFHEPEVIDQLALAIDKIKNNPTDRRIIVSAWNVGELDQMALPPCHLLFQFYVSNDQTLSIQVYMRSVDLALGIPFDIASYATLLHLVAAVTCCKPGRLIMDLGDCHIYSTHLDGVREQLTREPLPPPTIQLTLGIGLDFKMNDIVLCGYKHHPSIKFDMAV